MLLWLDWLLMVVSEAVEPNAPLPVAAPPALRPAEELPAPEFGYDVEVELAVEGDDEVEPIWAEAEVEVSLVALPEMLVLVEEDD